MKKTVKTETTRHTNGTSSIRHRVVLQHDTVKEPVLETLDALMKKSNPPHKMRMGGTQPD